MTASSISAVLRRAGFTPVPTSTRGSREGVRCTASVSGRVRVSADLDSDRQAAALADAARDALVARGYSVLTVPTVDNAFYVTGRAS